MQELTDFSKNIASGFYVLFNATFPVETLLTLQQNGYGLTDILCTTYNYIVVLSVVTVWLLIYYYTWLPINWVKEFTDIGYNHIKSESKSQKTSKEMVEEFRRRRALGELPPVYPNGWYALIESAELNAGQVKHTQALGENFAVLRSSSGKVHILDAYCPHLGANMAVSGMVRGDCLECPFHGWQFRGDDGTCSHIPYSDKVPHTAFVRSWISKEAFGFVFVWYHAEDNPPSWQIQSIPEIETGKLWYRGRFEIYTNCHVQDVLENIADISHFGCVHKPSVFAGSDLRSHNRLIHSYLKHTWSLDWKQHSATEESHMCSLHVKHGIRLFNKFTLLPSSATLTQEGPGFSTVQNEGFHTIVTVTPVEPVMIRIVFHLYCLPRLFLFGRIYLYLQLVMVERDIAVWNHKRYAMKPCLAKGDESITRHRRWFSQFYTANSPRLSSQQRSTTL